MQKRNYNYFLLIFFAFLLVVSIIFTQTLTDKATQALQKGNVEAVETFKTNNEMQHLVNLSFTLQSRLSQVNNMDKVFPLDILSDSLTLFGYNANVLNDAVARKGNVPNLKRLMDAVNIQLNISYAILDARQQMNVPLLDSLTRVLTKTKPAENVYHYGVLVEKFLENQLQKTLVTNSAHASQLSAYNRVLSVAAVIAVLIFTTIIVIRQWQQLVLIKELRVAREAAVKSRNAKDEFLANMSHELRTPLNSLIGFGNLLSDTPLDHNQKEYTNTIISNGYNLLHIVNDILDFSSIEAGKLRIKRIPFNLPELFEDLKRMFSAIVNEKKLTYHWDIDPQTPQLIKGDPERLKQVLVNLINNAIKFTSYGGVHIHVGVLPCEKEEMHKLVFSVKDTGEGIPKEKVDLIFERFEQLEQMTTRQHGGTGLGLSIVKSLVESMGGSVSVNSEIGLGSKFTFTAIFEKAMEAPAVASRNAGRPTADFSGYTALVVEDNAANRVLLKHLLKKYNLHIELAENGLEALERIQAKHYDLVLMDIQMPHMNGYKAISIIREELHINTPAIAMTAYVMENEVKRCFAAGFNDYISKPIEEPDIIGKIIKWMPARAEVAPPAAVVETTGEDGLDFFRELVGGDEAIMNELLGEIRKQWVYDKEALRAAAAAGDTLEMGRILHRVKSTFSALGPNHPIQQLLKKRTIATGSSTGDIGNTTEDVIREIDQFGKTVFIS
ncbi:ATP-binding protein [Niabella drilacis]|uniref:Sensory/regulatory protein RpfC n=1 Tax=Niabella drilacis (strain DSM 25811 / CCM 8410 / CCUG 62505 / LMG 26954 / E90) TaxID=1285928 RepID=A0A1G6YMT6_NIADE|nr:ATP-binding protein [Niabella drilacis]SDD91621.1 Signal transduction histidine kinase [Niabella drilacis]